MASDHDENERKRQISIASLEEARNSLRVHGPVPADEGRRLFAEETDASADLGRAPDAAARMAEIHARHEAALARLRAGEDRRARPGERRERRRSGR